MVATEAAVAVAVASVIKAKVLLVREAMVELRQEVLPSLGDRVLVVLAELTELAGITLVAELMAAAVRMLTAVEVSCVSFGRVI
jgi:hypothetical protein